MAPFKSTQSFSVGQFLKTFRNRDGFGPAALNSPVRTERIMPIIASGGNIDAPSGDYKYHVFTGPGTLTVTRTGTAEVLLVAGGGGGGSHAGPNGAGGGGAGGVVHHTNLNIGGNLTITIGGGGTPGSSTGAVGADGVDSTIVSPTNPYTITASGGGAGGYYGTAGTAGGSGGGGGGYGGNYSNAHAAEDQSTKNTSFIPQTGFNQYGNNGGAPSDVNPGHAGGGGGAGTVGGSSPEAEGAPTGRSGGGAGQPFTGFVGTDPAFAPLPSGWRTAVGPTGLFGGGGAGQSPFGASPTALGGPGGGGSGPTPAAIDNTGGGGAGTNGAPGGHGGDGICIIRYLA